MKTAATHLFISLLLVGIPALASAQERAERQKYEMVLVYDFEPREFVFIIGNSRFKSVAALKRFLERLPRGSELRWVPGCVRIGKEPILSSETALKHFQRFCDRIGVKFTLVPSG